MFISILTKDRNLKFNEYGLNSAKKIKLIIFYIVFLTNTTLVVIIVKGGNKQVHIFTIVCMEFYFKEL